MNSGTWVASNSELTPSESLVTTDDVSQYDMLNVGTLSMYNKGWRYCQIVDIDNIVDVLKNDNTLKPAVAKCTFNRHLISLVVFRTLVRPNSNQVRKPLNI